MINIINPYNKQKLKKKKNFYIDIHFNKFLIKKNIPRIIKNKKNYAKSFGYQWKKYSQTQLDSKTKLINYLRFFKSVNQNKSCLNYKRILEVGCGAGKFSSIILNNTKGDLYSIDKSTAVEAAYKNNKKFINRKYHLFQSDAHYLPFEDNSFDLSFCLGVLQHTNNIKKTIKEIIAKTKSGGSIVVDFYPRKGFWTKIHAKYILRFFAKKITHKKIDSIITRNIDLLIKIYFFLNKIHLGFLNRFVPICDIKNTIDYKSMTKKELKENLILDTLDMFSPAYDEPQNPKFIEKIFKYNNCTIAYSGYVNYFKNFKSYVIRAKKNY